MKQRNSHNDWTKEWGLDNVRGNPIMHIDPEGGSWIGVLLIGMTANTVRGIIEALYKIKLKRQIRDENVKLSEKIDEAEVRLKGNEYCLDERHRLYLHNMKLSVISELTFQGVAEEIIVDLLFQNFL